MQVRLPVEGHPRGGTGCALVGRVLFGGREVRALVHLLVPVVEIPVLAGLEARNQGMPGAAAVGRCMLAGRGVAATDVTALRATTQFVPPTVVPFALQAPGPTGRDGDIYSGLVIHVNN